MIIAGNCKHSTELRGTGSVCMSEYITGAINTGTFSVPHAENTVVLYARADGASAVGTDAPRLLLEVEGNFRRQCVSPARPCSAIQMRRTELGASNSMGNKAVCPQPA